MGSTGQLHSPISSPGGWLRSQLHSSSIQALDGDSLCSSEGPEGQGTTVCLCQGAGRMSGRTRLSRVAGVRRDKLTRPGSRARMAGGS